MRRAAPIAALAVLAAITLGTVSCAAPLLKLPAFPQQPSPTADAATVLAEATASCGTIRTLTAEIGVRGSVGRQRIRGRMIAGLETPDSVHLDAAAPFGESIFMFVAKGGRATLLLPRDDRALEDGAPAAVLEAVTGVPLDGASLRLALTGCADPSQVAEISSGGDRWRIGSGGQYFERTSPTASWRMVATVHQPAGRPAWQAEYRDFLNGLPRTVRFVSRQAGQFDLTLSLSGVEINTTLPSEAFELAIPPGTSPISLEELRRSGPLATGESTDGR